MKNFLNISNITGQQAEGFTGYHMGTHSLFWMPHFEASNSENAYRSVLCFLSFYKVLWKEVFVC